MGMKISGSPTPSDMRDHAKNPKFRSPDRLVRSYIERAATVAPAAIRYFGWMMEVSRLN